MTRRTSCARPEADPGAVLADLDSGRAPRGRRPDPTAPGGWLVDAAVKQAILAGSPTGRPATGRSAMSWQFRDRVGLPLKDLLDGPEAREARAADRPWRIVPGGTTVRAGVHLGPGVAIMPPSFVNIGAWIGDGRDGRFARARRVVRADRARGSISPPGVSIGGVLEPPGARPVIVEDDAFVGAGSGLFEGVLVGRGAVIGAGRDPHRHVAAVRPRARDRARRVPPRRHSSSRRERRGARLARARRARSRGTHGLSVTTAVIVKDRDAGTDARTALEAALR